MLLKLYGGQLLTVLAINANYWIYSITWVTVGKDNKKKLEVVRRTFDEGPTNPQQSSMGLHEWQAEGECLHPSLFWFIVGYKNVCWFFFSFCLFVSYCLLFFFPFSIQFVYGWWCINWMPKLRIDACFRRIISQ